MLEIRQALIEAGEHLPAAVRDEIVAAGREAIPALLAVLGDVGLAHEDGPGDGWAPIHAATLLGELRVPEAVEPLLAAFAEADWMEVIKDRSLQALHRIGELALEPTLRALAGASDDDRRDGYCAVLADLGVRDARVLTALLEQLARDACSGAMNLAGYGDPAALPVLLGALDEHEVELNGLMTDQTLIELEAAVRALGGEPRPAHLAKLKRMDDLRAEAVRHREALAFADRPAARRERPPRNAPCWCGSGGKYKKCHLDRDEAAQRGDPESPGCCDHTPDPGAWLALGEGERIELCLREHEPLPAGHPKPGNVRLHAAVHAVIENQLALGEPATVRLTLARLLDEGLSRHEATHAIGSVLASQLAAIVAPGARGFDAARYERELASLGADAWRARRPSLLQ